MGGSGGVVAKRCIAQTKGNRRKPRCSRIAGAGALTLQAHQGTNNVRFQGRLSASKKLKPGRYTVVVVATNAAGRNSTPSSLGFTIVKR